MPGPVVRVRGSVFALGLAAERLAWSRVQSAAIMYTVSLFFIYVTHDGDRFSPEIVRSRALRPTITEPRGAGKRFHRILAEIITRVCGIPCYSKT